MSYLSGFTCIDAMCLHVEILDTSNYLASKRIHLSAIKTLVPSTIIQYHVISYSILHDTKSKLHFEHWIPNGFWIRIHNPRIKPKTISGISFYHYREIDWIAYRSVGRSINLYTDRWVMMGDVIDWQVRQSLLPSAHNTIIIIIIIITRVDYAACCVICRPSAKQYRE